MTQIDTELPRLTSSASGGDERFPAKAMEGTGREREEEQEEGGGAGGGRTRRAAKVLQAVWGRR